MRVPDSSRSDSHGARASQHALRRAQLEHDLRRCVGATSRRAPDEYSHAFLRMPILVSDVVGEAEEPRRACSEGSAWNPGKAPCAASELRARSAISGAACTTPPSRRSRLRLICVRSSRHRLIACGSAEAPASRAGAGARQGRPNDTVGSFASRLCRSGRSDRSYDKSDNVQGRGALSWAPAVRRNAFSANSSNHHVH
jgi:hypothetical protein